MSKKINNLIFIFISFLFIGLLLFAFGCKEEKLDIDNKFFGLWQFEKNGNPGLISDAETDPNIMAIAIDDDSSCYVAYKGSVITGSLSKKNNDLIFTPEENAKKFNKNIVLKLDNDKLCVNTDDNLFCEMRRSEDDFDNIVYAYCTEHNLPLIDLELFFDSVKYSDSEDVLNQLILLDEEYQYLSDEEKIPIKEELSTKYKDDFISAYNKLDNYQKAEVNPEFVLAVGLSIEQPDDDDFSEEDTECEIKDVIERAE